MKQLKYCSSQKQIVAKVHSQLNGKYREIKHCNCLQTHIVYYAAKLYTIIFSTF